MSLSRAIALAGVHEHPTRWAPEKTEFQIMAECARGALDDCGLGLRDVDGLFAASMSMGPMGVVSLAGAGVAMTGGELGVTGVAVMACDSGVAATGSFAAVGPTGAASLLSRVTCVPVVTSYAPPG